MLNRLKTILSKASWYTLACIIVLLLAGPEIMVGMEVMALVEALGASTFVLMYLSGLKLFCSKLWNKFKSFESYSTFYVPPLSTLKEMPSLVIHAVPERTAVISFLAFITVGMSGLYFNLLIGL
ncbi:hypothetical protein [Psychrosphaera haliotis]|uniref:Uncharacterized protein n=1 Tax=Psychrosphaera haliotis TaxID=555083 RepID=A0A6N8F9D7_9GAMM|nr:hypothetical protein [Psychrosphaera haliotis]MUH73215.1 hypothetical protein [Psychrosphaera haliotis]